MRFTWDKLKAEQNLRKHRIAFVDAARVFADPLAIRKQDRVEDGEERWQIIGVIESFKLVVVAHTSYEDDNGEETIRIISARKAERSERRDYEDG